jgi:hypothetical protein
MSAKELRHIIELASEQMARWFAMKGAVGPMWHAVKRNGDHFIVPIPEYMMRDKDLVAETMRALFETSNVCTCVFVDEAWTAEVADGEAKDKLFAYLKTNGSLKDYPDRIEVVVFQGEDAEAGVLCALRKIIRPAVGPAHLGPLEFQDTKSSEGRFVGMLPQIGKPN